MKLTFDFNTKTVELHGNCNLSELMDKVKEVVGDDISHWKIAKTVEHCPVMQPYSYPNWSALPTTISSGSAGVGFDGGWQEVHI